MLKYSIIVTLFSTDNTVLSQSRGIEDHCMSTLRQPTVLSLCGPLPVGAQRTIGLLITHKIGVVMADKAPPCVNEAFTDRITVLETAGALNSESIRAETWRRRRVRLRGHMCVLPPSDLGLMTPEREMCSGCSFG